MTDKWWAIVRLPGSAHVVPVNDLVEHEVGEAECLCGPVLESHGDGWVHIHHSLDGREELEG